MDPETIIRKVVDDCCDCDVCRYLMDATCQVFPEIYRLWDAEKESGQKIAPADLRRLVDLCNFCGICPCPNIRADIMKAKTAFIDRDGFKFGVRTLEDVARVGKLCGAWPQLTNFMLQNKTIGHLVKETLSLHPSRKLPRFPRQSFDTWSLEKGLNRQSHVIGHRRKVVYFAGCTGRFLFPEVAQAVVGVLQHNNVDLYYPEQKCCGMPMLLEGDHRLAHQCVEFNIDHLAEAVQAGYDIVCSCSTCGYMFKHILKDGADWAVDRSKTAARETAEPNSPLGSCHPVTDRRQAGELSKNTFFGLIKDEGLFSTIDPHKRILVAENTYDLGEYLDGLYTEALLSTAFGALPGHSVYYPPCHLREQKIGEPYLKIMKLIPELAVDRIDCTFDCCGMAGIMGFKRGFHQTSIDMSRRLVDKINSRHPELLVTDCLSCRLQFKQLTTYEVAHPIEVINQAYVI